MVEAIKLLRANMHDLSTLAPYIEMPSITSEFNFAFAIKELLSKCTELSAPKIANVAACSEGISVLGGVGGGGGSSSVSARASASASVSPDLSGGSYVSMTRPDESVVDENERAKALAVERRRQRRARRKQKLQA